jgi:hypothetical protein
MLVYNFDLNKKYNKNPDDLTFNEFFSKELLQEVDRYIRLPKKSYRIINLGIQPSVTQCSGFYTLDSYQNNYPLEYKHAFRKIIQDELAKDKEAEKYFDEWGNRCYVPFNAKKDSAGLQTIDELSINTAAFKELGGQFIFSAAAIKNSEALHLKFHRVFKHPESKYTLYLYEAL